MQISQFNSKILEIIEETPEVKTFVLECPHDFTFIAGQFIMLSFPGEKLAKAYSISSSPTKKGTIELTIKIEQYPEEELPKHLTPRLGKVEQGQEITIKGPYGKFILDETKDRFCFLAGGTGIAPLMSMIRYCLDKNLKKHIILINSNKTPEHIIYKEELAAIKNKIHLVQTITHPEPGCHHPNHNGRISKELLNQHLNKQAMFYICGPNEMIKQSKAYLLDLEVPQEQIHVELWG